MTRYCVWDATTLRCVRCGLRLAQASKQEKNPCRLSRRVYTPKKPRKRLTE